MVNCRCPPLKPSVCLCWTAQDATHIPLLQTENAVITADQREIRRYREDTHTMREELEQLRTRQTTFQAGDFFFSGGYIRAVLSWLTLGSTV